MGAAEFMHHCITAACAVHSGVFDISAAIDLELMRASMALEKIRRRGTPRRRNPRQASRLGCRRLPVERRLPAVGILRGAVRPNGVPGRAHPARLSSSWNLAAPMRRAAARRRQSALERAVGLDPGLAEAWRELSAQRLLKGEIASADDAAYFDSGSSRPTLRISPMPMPPSTRTGSRSGILGTSTFTRGHERSCRFHASSGHCAAARR